MDAATPALLEIDGLTVGYRNSRTDRTVILQDVHARAGAGELVGLVGPNGAGKSTLLRSIAGLQPVFAGSARLCGTDTRTLGRREIATRLATVLTDRFDPGRLRARDIVGLGRHPYSSLTGRLDAHDREVVADSLDAVGAAHLADTDLGELSDGQRQRVMVARALAQEPRVLLLDEPTAFLDPPGRVSLLELIRSICTGRGIAAVVCTHDIESILSYADQVWVAGRDTALLVGGPEDLARDGVLAGPFATPGVHFDLGSLTFRADSRGRPPARVDGTGVDAFLAERALRRAGYDVTYGERTTSDAVVAIPAGDGSGWVLEHPRHGRTSHPDLAGLHTQAQSWRSETPVAEASR